MTDKNKLAGDTQPLTAYRPNPLADYFDRRAGEERDRFNTNFMWLPMHLGVAGISAAQSGMGGAVSRNISRLMALGNFGIAGGIDIPEMIDSHAKIPEMKRAAEMWRNTGMPGRPGADEHGNFQPPADSDASWRAFHALPKPPEVPRSGLETIRHPRTGEVMHVPPGTTWEPVYGVEQAEGQPQSWRLRYPGQ